MWCSRHMICYRNFTFFIDDNCFPHVDNMTIMIMFWLLLFKAITDRSNEMAADDVLWAKSHLDSGSSMGKYSLVVH